MKAVLGGMLIPFFLAAAPQAGAPELLWPGLTLEQFRQARPGVLPEKLAFEKMVEREGQLGELKGVWRFRLAKNLVVDVRFSCESPGVESLGGDDSQAEKRLSVQHKAFDAKLVELRNLLSKTLKRPPRKELRPDVSATSLGRDPLSLLYRADWEVNGLRIVLRMRLLGDMGMGLDNKPVEVLRYQSDLRFMGTGWSGCVPGHPWYPGMDGVDFAKLESGLLPTGLAINRDCVEEQTLFGLKGKWHYGIRDGELDWITYDWFWTELDRLDEASFKRGLAAAKALVKHYTRLLGEPATEILENTRYRDPEQEPHSGYKVLDVRWKTPQGKLRVSFEFRCEGGQYFLMLRVGVFRPDSSCFERAK